MNLSAHSISPPDRAESDWPPVVIACAFNTGVQVARHLVRRNVRVRLIDCDRTVDGFQSIYGNAEWCPNPDDEPEAWLHHMIALGERMQERAVLIAASDQFVAAIGHFAEQLAPHFIISPSAKLQAELATKDGQFRIATGHGLPTPITFFATHEDEAAEFAKDAPYPVLIKPLQYRFWNSAPRNHPMKVAKALRAEDPAQLMKYFHLANTLSPGVIFQELIPGPETNKREHIAIYRRDGARLGHLTLRKLRSVELGSVAVTEPVDDPRTADICDAFFQSVGYRGTCEIELVWDMRDNLPKMMDINPRFSGSGNALIHGGIDQAWLVYLDLIGAPVEAVAPPVRDFRHVMLLTDAHAVRQSMQNGELSWSKLRATYRPPIHFWDLEVRDWRRALATLGAIARVSVGTIVYRLLHMFRSVRR